MHDLRSLQCQWHERLTFRDSMPHLLPSKSNIYWSLTYVSMALSMIRSCTVCKAVGTDDYIDVHIRNAERVHNIIKRPSIKTIETFLLSIWFLVSEFPHGSRQIFQRHLKLADVIAFTLLGRKRMLQLMSWPAGPTTTLFVSWTALSTGSFDARLEYCSTMIDIARINSCNVVGGPNAGAARIERRL